MRDSLAAEWLKPYRGALFRTHAAGAVATTVVPDTFEAYVRVCHPVLMDEASALELGIHEECLRLGRVEVEPDRDDPLRFGCPWKTLLRAAQMQHGEKMSPEGLDEALSVSGLSHKCMYPSGWIGPWLAGRLVRALADSPDEPWYFMFDVLTHGGNEDVVIKRGRPDFLTEMHRSESLGLSVSPEYWWPADRRFVAFSHADVPQTIIAGSESDLEKVLADGECEVVRMSAADRFW